jgi:class 3 adenylate cyclase
MLQSRELAAIMFADIVGKTALMGDDEQKHLTFTQKQENTTTTVQ